MFKVSINQTSFCVLGCGQLGGCRSGLQSPARPVGIGFFGLLWLIEDGNCLSSIGLAISFRASTDIGAGLFEVVPGT